MKGLSLDLSDEITAALAGLTGALSRPELRAVMGRAVRGTLVQHFERLDQSRHRNETGVHFYGQAARAVQQPDIGTDGFTVTVNQVGIAQRYFGGTITAGANGSGKKFLTIPAVPAALGRRAGEFTNLRFVFFRGKDLGALVATDPAKVVLKGAPRATKEQSRRLVPREDGRLQVVFWLVRSVKQEADPTVLPTEEEMAAAAFGAAETFLAREYARQGGGAA